jgi:glycosyltransferase involved in cell wall biosynthesis
MRIWVVETRVANPGGHEIELNRLIIEELKALGHQAVLAVPCDYAHDFDYPVEIRRLQAKAAPPPAKSLWGGLKRSWLSELNRRRLFRELLSLADEHEALIFPSSTFRFLRTLKTSPLRFSQKPVVFVFLGASPKEKSKLLGLAETLARFDRIKLAVASVASATDDFEGSSIRAFPPPAQIPRDVPWRPGPTAGPLVFGFFGQYRREKNLPALLDAILAARLEQPVKFLIQILAAPQDRAEAEALARTYSAKDARLHFFSKSLSGRDWQQAVLDVHALLAPYGAERFKWHLSSILLTAVGFRRPLLASDNLNPEIMSKFQLGRACPGGDLQALTQALEGLAADLADPSAYQAGLAAALAHCHPRKFVENIVSLLLQ